MGKKPDPNSRGGEAFQPGPGVCVLTGPAGAGKTSAALALYRRHLDELGRPRCLLIVPNFPAAAQLRGRLLAASPSGVLVAPAVTTFAALAAGILSAAGEAPDTLRGVQRHLLLVRIVSELSSAGVLKAIGPLADTPGLVSALDAAIAELKRAAVEPAELAKAVNPNSAKDADLLEVYRRYQEHLRRANRFDVEGQMWLARDVLARRADAPLGWDDVAAVAADGFTDFTPTQLEMLALLSRRVETLLITLPLGDSARPRLWHWTQRTLQRVRQAMPDAQVTPLDGPADPMGSLFDLTGEAAGAAKKTRRGFSIALLEAAGLEAEVRAVARAVKADLVAGAEAGSVAVLARSLAAYAEPVERIFAEHDVPVAARPRALNAANVIRYVLELLALPPNYEFHHLLAVVKSSYFRPAALGEGFDQATVATAEMAIRTANVLGGRETYAAALGRLARRARLRPAEPEEDEGVELGPLTAKAEDIEQAAAMLEALLARLDGLSAAADLPRYVSAVRALISDLQLPAAAAECDDDAVVAADLRALDAFDELLDDLSAAALPVADAAAMRDLLARAAAAALVPPARRESLVAVLDVLDARALRFDKLYLLGVNEKVFPQLRRDRCFIDEPARAEWARRGVVLDRRRDLIGREMLLFYLAATRADSALTFSYVTTDAAGKGQAPSVFVAELEAAAERQGIGLERRRVGPGEFVPPADELASPADAFNAAVAAAFDDSPRTRARLGAAARPLLGWATENRPELLGRAAFGIFAAARRWRQGPPDAFDGRIDDARLLRDLTGRIPAQRVFSASELNSYAQCPWRFFATYLLRLEPLAVPELQMTPADRGSFCHAVLWRLFTALRDRFGTPVSLAELAEADVEAALAEAVEAEKRRLAEAAVHSQLWEMQTRFWRGMLAGYLADQRQGQAAQGGAVYFELGFGAAGLPDDRMDPASRPEPVTIQAGPLKVRLRGKIDRVDGPSGPLLAVDYKTGRVPGGREIVEGRDLQLALYAKALAAMFDRPVAGGAYHDVRGYRHRYFTASSHPRAREGEPADYEEQLAHSMEQVAACVAGMRRGRFDALPAHDCPTWCPYRTICHYSDHRARRKGGSPAAGEGGDE